jgi:hypothetical protein
VSFRGSLSLVMTTTAALAALSCASHTPSPEASPSLSGAPASLSLASVQWEGSFQAVQQQAGNADAPRGRNNATGRVVLVASGKNSLRAKITLNAASATSQYVHWALVSGRCGSPAIPLLTVNQFPDISMSNGRGQVDADVPLELPTTGSYHVDVYWSNGQDQADVMTCANLRLGRRSAS